jgi:hypothetical protein
MNAREILASYDAQMRREAPVHDGERLERLPYVTRVTDLHGASPHNTVLYSAFDAAVADQVIVEQIAHYAALGREFEWKVYEHDRPPDLVARLAVRGFTIGEPESLMVLDLDGSELGRAESPERVGDAIAIRRVAREAEVADVVAVQGMVWQEDVSDLRDQLTRGLRDEPDRLNIYVAYVGAVPVSAAWIRYHPGRAFADLWGGSTLAEYRKLGIYRMMVARRARDAREHGVRFLSVDASAMSRPILERLGFVYLTTTVPCISPPRTAMDTPSDLQGSPESG